MRSEGKLLFFFDLLIFQDGPFKVKQVNGCPHVDKFATYSLQSIATNKQSPRIGILGAHTFPSEREFANVDVQSTVGRIDDVSSSVNKQIKTLEDQLVAGYDLLQVFKEEADEIRKQIDVMMNVLVEKTEVVQDEVHQDIRTDYKTLKFDIKTQRDENEMLYKTMKNLVKETESQKTKIAIFTAKIEELEQHVGILANSPDPNFTTNAPIVEEAPEFIDQHEASYNAAAQDLDQSRPDLNDINKPNAINNLSGVNLRGNSSMDEYGKRK